jgi:hypothetical protein
MYCSGCGSQIQEGLSYCSRCGRRVAGEEKPARDRMSPVVVAGNTAGVGFVAFIFVMLVLVLNGVVGSNIVGVTFFYFLALFLLCSMFLRQARHSAKYQVQPAPDSAQLYVKPVATAQLPEAMDRPASVTEHTTRTLDNVPVRER